MLVNNILGRHSFLTPEQLLVLKTNCSQFFFESTGYPIYKVLPSSYNTMHKVKVRQHKRQDNVSEAFNQAFGQEVNNIRQRAIFTYGTKQQCLENTENFYVFPIDGYNFMYCKEVENSSVEYQQILNTLFEAYGNDSKAYDIVCDLLKRTYIRENLVEGITCKAEIIMYGIPYFYAVKTKAVDNYNTLFNVVT